jgi:hypothetical protein
MDHSINDGITNDDSGATPNRTLPQAADMSHIKGWAIDANPRNDPSYPMKHRLRSAAERQSWQRPTQQKMTTEVLHSNERPSVSAVFGTSAPPSGLSGMIRRFAFRYSEGTFAHWLSLLLADRVNMVEAVVDDVAHGHVPNLIAEKGLKAEWEHNRPAVIKKAAIGAVVVALAFAFITRKRDRD